MADESSPTKQQRDRAILAILLMMVLGGCALIFGTSGLSRTRELFSWYSLLILGSLFLFLGSLVGYIKVSKAFPPRSASADIRFGIIMSTVIFAFALYNSYGDSWPREVPSTRQDHLVWIRWIPPTFSLVGGLFFLGRGLSNRSKESAAKAAPETPAPTPPEDE